MYLPDIKSYLDMCDFRMFNMSTISVCSSHVIIAYTAPCSMWMTHHIVNGQAKFLSNKSTFWKMFRAREDRNSVTPPPPPPGTF